MNVFTDLRRARWVTEHPITRAVVFAASIGGSLAVGMVMVASHVPFRADVDRLGSLAAAAGVEQGWRATHVLLSGCNCSERVAAHLIRRGRMVGLTERVVWVGGTVDQRQRRDMEAAGFRVSVMTGEVAAERFGLQGAPWLVLNSPDGRVRYAGGYSLDSAARQGYQDERIWATVKDGGDVVPYPAFGCLVAHHLRARLDPLGLKYRR